MNYDAVGHIRHPSVQPDFAEPDCSPHPFDVMAIYALYETVPVVSITGSTSGTEGDQARLTASASGGVGPYTYRWSSPSGLFVFSPDPQTRSVSVTLPDVDDGLSIVPVLVVAADSRGQEASASVYVTTYARRGG